MSGRVHASDRGQLREAFEDLRTSYWLVPLMMGLGAIALSLYMTSDLVPAGSVRGGVEGVREILATIASSVVAVMGVVFSVLIVVLSLASSQYGSRVLRTFQRDHVHQFTIGVFIATFLYSVLLLRTLRAGASPPEYALLLAVALAVASVAMFVYLIHHVARTIQAPLIAAAISHEWLMAAPQLQPAATDAELAADQAQIDLCLRRAGARTSLSLGRGGYLQAIDARVLVALAERVSGVFEVTARPGDFVLPRDVVAIMHGDAPRRIDAPEIAKAFVLGKHRTLAQDARFAVVQLVEIALHALSPGINEPYTAVTCVHRLGEILVRAAGENLPVRCRFDAKGELRVILPALTFADLAAEAFEQIIVFSAEQPYVLRSLLDVFSRIPMTRDDVRAGLAEQTAAISRAAEACRDEVARRRVISWAAELSARLALRSE